MQLIRDGRFVDDARTAWDGEPGLVASEDRGVAALAPDGQAPDLPDLIVPLEAYGSQLAARTGRIGVRMPPDTDPDTIVDVLARVDLVAVSFPSCADGRGFSLARRLRQRGFAGELRASGPLIADQHAFARACGFDAIEIPDWLAARQPEAQWLQALHDIGPVYQPGVRAVLSVLEARHRG